MREREGGDGRGELERGQEGREIWTGKTGQQGQQGQSEGWRWTGV